MHICWSGSRLVIHRVKTMTFHAFDLLFGLLLLFSSLLGFSKGLYSELPSLVLLAAGLLLSHQMHSEIALWLGGHFPLFLAYPRVLQGLGWLLPLVIAAMLSRVLALLGCFAPVQCWWKRWLAAISGLLKGSLLGLALYPLLSSLPFVHSWMLSSWSAPQLDSLATWILQRL